MEREELVSKAKAMQAIAQQMSEHNDMMLAGLQSQSMAADEPPAGPTDFVKRNRAAAGERDGIDKKGRALLARAQVMSGAAVHLGELRPYRPPAARPTAAPPLPQPLRLAFPSRRRQEADAPAAADESAGARGRIGRPDPSRAG